MYRRISSGQGFFATVLTNGKWHLGIRESVPLNAHSDRIWHDEKQSMVFLFRLSRPFDGLIDLLPCRS